MASITKRNRSYRARIYQGNNQSISKSFANESEATNWVKKTQAELELGIYEKPRPKSQISIYSFQEAAERYIATHSIHKRNYISEAGILRILIKRWDGLSIYQVNKHSVLALRDELLRLGRSHSTINHYFNSISKVYQMLRDEMDIHIDIPTSGIKRLPSKKGRVKRVNGNIEINLLTSCNLLGYTLLTLIIRFAIQTGMRRGELMGLKWTDIDLTNRRAYLHTSKNGEPRQIPLSKEAISVLQGLNKKDGDQVFPMTLNVLRNQFNKARVHSKENWNDPGTNPFVDLRLHDLRHEAISRMSDLGLNVIELSSISGHKTLAMLSRYAHPSHQAIFNKLDASHQNGVSEIHVSG